jgi:hypothetical protein
MFSISYAVNRSRPGPGIVPLNWTGIVLIW